MAANPAARPALARTSIRAVCIATRASATLVGGVLREVLVRERLRVAPGLQDARRCVGRRRSARHARALELRLAADAAEWPWAASAGPAPPSGRSARCVGRSPCSRQNASNARSKTGEVVATMDEQGAARVVHVLARADVHVLQRLGDVEEAPDVHLQAERAQQPPEDEHVREEGRHDARRSARRQRGQRGRRATSPRTASMSSLDLSTTPSVASTISGSSASLSSAASAATQSSVSDTPGSLYNSIARSSCTSAVTCAARRAAACGTRALHDRQFLLERGVLDPLVEAPALQRVVHLARPVGGEDDERRFGRAHGAELGNGDLELREQFEQVAFELLVGAIDLVDQQDGRPRPRRVDRLQQRPLDQERVAVQLAPGAWRGRARRPPRGCAARRAAARSPTRTRRA